MEREDGGGIFREVTEKMGCDCGEGGSWRAKASLPDQDRKVRVGLPPQ